MPVNRRSFMKSVAMAAAAAAAKQAPVMPVWARIGTPLIYLLNVLVGFHLLLLAKWEE